MSRIYLVWKGVTTACVTLFDNKEIIYKENVHTLQYFDNTDLLTVLYYYGVT